MLVRARFAVAAPPSRRVPKKERLGPKDGCGRWRHHGGDKGCRPCRMGQRCMRGSRSLGRGSDDGLEGGRYSRLVALVHTLVRRCKLTVVGTLEGDCSEDFFLVLPRAMGIWVRRARLTSRGASSGGGGRTTLHGR